MWSHRRAGQCFVVEEQLMDVFTFGTYIPVYHSFLVDNFILRSFEL